MGTFCPLGDFITLAEITKETGGGFMVIDYPLVPLLFVSEGGGAVNTGFI